MTYSKAIDNNVIFSIWASRVILVINLGHDGLQFVTNLLSHRFYHKDETKGWILIKTSVHGSSKCAGCAFDKASFAARSASSFPVISRWLGIQQHVMNVPLDNIYWHVCKTLFTRGFLLSWLSMACITDILSENITKRSTEDKRTTNYAYIIDVKHNIMGAMRSRRRTRLARFQYVRFHTKLSHSKNIHALKTFDDVLLSLECVPNINGKLLIFQMTVLNTI